MKLYLFYPISDPIIIHVDFFGSPLLDVVIGNSHCWCAVYLNWGGVGGWRYPSSSSAVLIEMPCLVLTKTPEISASAADHVMFFKTAAISRIAPLCLASCPCIDLSLRKKWPPTLLLSFGSERYDASLWI